MENLEKSWNFKIVISTSGKVLGKKIIHKHFGKFLEICHIHRFISTV